MGKPLTPDLVLLRSKADRLDNVRNLNLWGNDIEDVSILKEMANVEVLSLSVNKIATLKDFQYCARLTELYLRKNLISDLTEVHYLQNLPALRVLWLWDNPCAEAPNYRPYVIKCLPNLVKLDNQPITPEERKSAASTGRDEPPARAPQPVPVAVEPRREVQQQRPATSENPRPAVPERVARPRVDARPNGDSRSENILCAVLALLKELDESELELVKRDIDLKLGVRR